MIYYSLPINLIKVIGNKYIIIRLDIVETKKKLTEELN